MGAVTGHRTNMIMFNWLAVIFWLADKFPLDTFPQDNFPPDKFSPNNFPPDNFPPDKRHADSDSVHDIFALQTSPCIPERWVL